MNYQIQRNMVVLSIEKFNRLMSDVKEIKEQLLLLQKRDEHNQRELTAAVFAVHDQGEICKQLHQRIEECKTIIKDGIYDGTVSELSTILFKPVETPEGCIEIMPGVFKRIEDAKS